jgi:hypothetical protein
MCWLQVGREDEPIVTEEDYHQISTELARQYGGCWRSDIAVLLEAFEAHSEAKKAVEPAAELQAAAALSLKEASTAAKTSTALDPYALVQVAREQEKKARGASEAAIKAERDAAEVLQQIVARMEGTRAQPSAPGAASGAAPSGGAAPGAFEANGDPVVDDDDSHPDGWTMSSIPNDFAAELVEMRRNGGPN